MFSSLHYAKHLDSWRAVEMNFILITFTGISLQQNSYVSVAMNLKTLAFQLLKWLDKGVHRKKKEIYLRLKKWESEFSKHVDDWCQIDKVPDGSLHSVFPLFSSHLTEC